MGDEFCAHVLNNKEIREQFANAETGVYWDVEDFPVTDFVSFNENIRSALVNAGYHGKVSITAYYGDKKPPRSEEAAGITFESGGSKRGRMHSMLVDMYLWELDNRSAAPTNLMVITKNMMPADDEDDTQFITLLGNLNFTCYNVLLALPDDYPLKKMPFELNFTAWRWSDLCAGGNPLDDSLVKSLRDDYYAALRNAIPHPPQSQSKVIPMDCRCSLCVEID